MPLPFGEANGLDDWLLGHIRKPRATPCTSCTYNAYLRERNVIGQLDSIANLAYRSQLADNTLTERESCTRR